MSEHFDAPRADVDYDSMSEALGVPLSREEEATDTILPQRVSTASEESLDARREDEYEDAFAKRDEEDAAFLDASRERRTPQEGLRAAAETGNGAPRVHSAYLDEDEELASDDVVLLDQSDKGMVRQLDNAVIWQFTGLYENDDELGALRAPRKLRNEPPKFVISSSNGDAIEFQVTQNLAHQLEKGFGAIYKAGFGIDTRDKHRKYPMSVNGGMEWVRDHPAQALMMLALLGVALYALLSF